MPDVSHSLSQPLKRLLPACPLFLLWMGLWGRRFRLPADAETANQNADSVALPLPAPAADDPSPGHRATARVSPISRATSVKLTHRNPRVLALAALVCALCAVQLWAASIIAAEVAGAAKAGDFATADKLLKQYKAQHGVDADYLEADSWVGRGRLFVKSYQAALDNASDVRQSCLKLLTARKLDAESSLPAALGASIEVTGQALAGLGRRDEAVTFLRAEMEKWRTTSIGARIQKNINLLSLEGKPAPALDISQSVTGPQPRPLSAHSGHPVLLFFWAHWCSDCKQEIGVIRQVETAFKAKGLEVIAPTQHYGYVAGGVDAPPSLETPYIAKIFSIYYSALGNVEVPLSEANFVRYGVSTTPTLVLVNGAGIVTLYHPGLMTLAELSAALRR